MERGRVDGKRATMPLVSDWVSEKGPGVNRT